MAMGMFVVPAWNELMNPSAAGTSEPIATPAAMAAKIQNVSQRSRNESFLATPSDTGLQPIVGFVARTKALRNLPSTSGPRASTSIPAEVRNSRASSTL